MNNAETKQCKKCKEQINKKLAEKNNIELLSNKYKEELELLILKARYQEANLSVEEKKADRFREVIDEYYSFINNYPDSPNREEADNIFKIATKYVKDY